MIYMLRTDSDEPLPTILPSFGYFTDRKEASKVCKDYNKRLMGQVRYKVIRIKTYYDALGKHRRYSFQEPMPVSS